MTSDLKARILDLSAPDLEKVEQALAENLDPHLDLVRQIASHLLFSGGKRLRPLLMIHSARICGYANGFEILFSTIFEYLHAATLLHDDVVDQADIRRGKVAAHHQWATPQVVLTGDFLLAKALELSARTENPKVISVIAGITREMSQGEIDQLSHKGKADLSPEDYFEIIRRKTAVLIQGACQSGALIAGADHEHQEALKRFGYHIGMAFQMADDLLDYTATAKELGKNPGADMREGKLTLPLIHSLARASQGERKKMLELVFEPEFDPDKFETLKQKIMDLEGIEYTQSLATDHIKKAKENLDLFEDGDSKSLLGMIADYAVQRKV